ncbi:MAG: glycosyltransferase [Acidimicrobiia bacterium]|nr:glycosyltransferase [Acidimicrobiia bacterium]
MGRLSKVKGAALLPSLGSQLEPPLRLRVIGTGYLRSELASKPSLDVIGELDQDRVIEATRRCRGVVFPSLWPEPGGIVGVDAILRNTPISAFDVGSPTSWPNTHRVPPPDIGPMADWANTLPRRPPIPADLEVTQLKTYCRVVGRHATRQLTEFADTCRITHTTSDIFHDALAISTAR